jgi:hypothetical protein
MIFKDPFSKRVTIKKNHAFLKMSGSREFGTMELGVIF